MDEPFGAGRGLDGLIFFRVMHQSGLGKTWRLWSGKVRRWWWLKEGVMDCLALASGQRTLLPVLQLRLPKVLEDGISSHNVR